MSKYEYFPVGDDYQVKLAKTREALDSLPPAFYNIEFDGDTSYRYVPVSSTPPLPELIGKDALELLDVLCTPVEGTNCSAFLWGSKGCGKSLTALHRAKIGIANNIPVISIIDGFTSKQAKMVMDDFHSPVIFYMDEYDDKTAKFYGDSEVEQGEEAFFNLISEPRYNHIQWIMTSNSRPRDKIIARPGRVRYLVEMNDISKNTMVTLVDKYKDAIPNDIRDYLLYQIKYNHANANSDLVEQCCRIATTCDSMLDYQNKAKLINAFDGHVRFELNTSYIQSMYRMSVLALQEIQDRVVKAKEFSELLEAHVMTVKSDESEDKPVTLESAKKDVLRYINRYIDSKEGTVEKPNLLNPSSMTANAF